MNISHAALAEKFGVYTVSNFEVKTTEETPFTFGGNGSVNFIISNLKADVSISSKATALKAFKENYKDVGIVFKLIEPEYFDLSSQNITILKPYIEVEEVPVYIHNLQGTLQIGYLSLEELVYSKDQVDEKFITKSSMSDKTHFYTLADKTASKSLYSYISTKNLVIADFEDCDETVPFIGPTVFIKECVTRIVDDIETKNIIFKVYSNNKIYL
jgi:hypothetical protein